MKSLLEGDGDWLNIFSEEHAFLRHAKRRF